MTPVEQIKKCPEVSYTNSQREKLSVRTLNGHPEFDGQHLLIIHDDPPPLGTSAEAVMLLDQGTADWLRTELDRLFPSGESNVS